MKVSKSKAVIFSVAVAFVSVFFFAYAVQAFYPAPVYEDFCGEYIKPVLLDKGQEITREICEENKGEWTAQDLRCVTAPCPQGYCDYYSKCQREYDDVRKPYERNVFFANLGLGIVLFVVAFFLAIEAVSSGLMGGAVMLIVYGSMRYWGELSDVWRTLMLGFALVVLIWLGYKKLKE